MWVSAVVLYGHAFRVCPLVGECPCRRGCLNPGYVCWVAWGYRLKPEGEPCLPVGGAGGGGGVVVGGDEVQQGPRTVDDRGLLRLTQRAQAIITQGIGVYATPLLQPTQITTRNAQGNPVYVYHPTAIARLPVPSNTDIIYFTDPSGGQQRTPVVGCASARITRRADGLHVDHHTGASIFWASSYGELRTWLTP